MSRATATLFTVLDELDPDGRIDGDASLLQDTPQARVANDQLHVVPTERRDAPLPLHEATSVVSSATAGEPDVLPLTTWIDALALTLAAGLRVGASGLAVREATAPAAPATTSAEPEVMDADQVASFLHVDRKTVYEYALRGVIPHRRLGKRLLFSRTALIAWLGGASAAEEG